MFCKISIDSSIEVGSINTFWNRLSKAPSFSMYWRYSSNVVAPITCISPLANAGLNIFDASNDPEAPPAPIIVWISSINKIISLDFSSSFITAFMRSSNCPLYLVPATKDAKSKEMTRLPKSTRDTFFCTILKANPSAIADFPTPGSPINIGLFFLRLDNICDTRSISAWRPTIGSNLSSSAIAVKSLPKLSNTGVFDLLLDFFELDPKLDSPEPFSLLSSVLPGNSDLGIFLSSNISSNSSFTLS